MAIRSTLTSMIDRSEAGSITGLYIIFYYIDLVGGAFVNFVLALTFSAGLQWGGQWTGLPLFFAAGMWFGVTAIVLFVKFSEKKDIPSVSSEES